MNLNSKSNKENMQMKGNSEQMLIGNNGIVKSIELTEGITNLLRKNLLENFAIIDPDSFFLFVRTSRDKNQDYDGYSYEELIKFVEEKFDLEETSEYIVEKSLDFLLDSGIFNAGWKEDNNYCKRRFSNDNEISKQFAPIKDEIIKGGPEFLKGSNALCERILLNNFD